MEAGDLIAGRYRLSASVGAGAVGEVWRATDERLQNLVAVKFLFDRRGDQVDRFRREATILARLDNPSIVRAIDYDASHDPPFIVMSFVEGRTLSAEPRPATVARTRRLLTPVAEALVAAHAAGVAHRDLKPGNVLLGQNGRVFVTDFGLARAEDEAGLTATEVRLGTPEYWSPEQARGFPAGPPADIYALATMAFELLAGRLPFPTPERGDRLAASYLRVSQESPKLTDVAPAVAAAEPELAAFVDQALRILPDERPTAPEALAAIGRGMTASDEPLDEPRVERTVVIPPTADVPVVAPTVSTAPTELGAAQTPPVSDPGVGSGRKVAALALGVLALGGAAVGSILAFSGDDNPSPTTDASGLTDQATTDTSATSTDQTVITAPISAADRSYAQLVASKLSTFNELQTKVNSALRTIDGTSGSAKVPEADDLYKAVGDFHVPDPNGANQEDLGTLATRATYAHSIFSIDASYVASSSATIFANDTQAMSENYKKLDTALERFGVSPPVPEAEQPAIDAAATAINRLSKSP